MPERQTITIPVPLVAPMGIPVDTPEAVQEVWDAFVKPEQESNMPQSVEMRVLMAILRAVYAGLSDAAPSEADECSCARCDPGWGDGGVFPTRLSVCPDCGNKRCPKGTDHDNECTGSNEPGQEGSRYA